MNMGLNRFSWSPRPAIVLRQTDANVLSPKEEGKHLDRARPPRPVPSVVGHKDGVSPDRTNGRNRLVLRNFNCMASTDRHVKARKMCHVGEDGRRHTVLGKINAPHPNAAEKTLQRRDDDSRRSLLRTNSWRRPLAHKMLR